MKLELNCKNIFYISGMDYSLNTEVKNSGKNYEHSLKVLNQKTPLIQMDSSYRKTKAGEHQVDSVINIDGAKKIKVGEDSLHIFCEC